LPGEAPEADERRVRRKFSLLGKCSPRFRVGLNMRRLSSRTLVFYACVIALITISFGWQMLHGVCPVP